jgi:hypothetical protein
MKLTKNIFTVLICAVLAMPAFAATDTSCDNEENEYINQRLALCSVHAYNIGATENPTTADQRALMNDVVALKATVMTQQIKKQYDFLEATIKRIKTQLEKAVLVSKLEAAGAATEAANGGGSSGTNAGLANTRDCSATFNTGDALQCLQQNFNAIYMATSNNTKRPDTATRKQINKDMAILDGLSVFVGTSPTYAFKDSNGNRTTPTQAQMTACGGNGASNDCVTLLQTGIRKLMSAQESASRGGGGTRQY